MPEILIESIADPRIAVYRDLSRSNLSRHSGCFIVEGKLLVERLLASEYPILSLLTAARQADQWRDRLPGEVPIFTAPAPMISEIVGFRFHRGLLACGQRMPTASLAQLAPSPTHRATVVICSQVLDPTNLGSIVRNGAAFGVDGIILGPQCADPFSRRVIRVSMGTVFKIPIRESHDWLVDAADLRTRFGFEIAATVLDEKAERLMQAGRGQRLALVFGTEGEGLAPREQQACDRRVTLPMSHNTDSLNVATACGIFLYHFTRLA